MLSKLVSVYMILVVVYALLSWLPGAQESWLSRVLGRLIEPFQRQFRFATIGMISFAPVIALIVLAIIRNALGIWLPALIMRMIG